MNTSLPSVSVPFKWMFSRDANYKNLSLCLQSQNLLYFWCTLNSSFFMTNVLKTTYYLQMIIVYNVCSFLHVRQVFAYDVNVFLFKTCEIKHSWHLLFKTSRTIAAENHSRYFKTMRRKYVTNRSKAILPSSTVLVLSKLKN